MYEYRGKVKRVIDGDTVDVDIDLGFNTWIKNERVRIMGIDTPESRTRNKIEKRFGLLAKARLKSLLGKQIVLKTQIDRKGQDMKGKFGRILGDFMYRGKLISKILCEEGHAVPYFGGSKAKLKTKHLKNRQKLIDLGKIKGPIQ